MAKYEKGEGEEREEYLQISTLGGAGDFKIEDTKSMEPAEEEEISAMSVFFLIPFVGRGLFCFIYVATKYTHRLFIFFKMFLKYSWD